MYYEFVISTVWFFGINSSENLVKLFKMMDLTRFILLRASRRFNG